MGRTATSIPLALVRERAVWWAEVAAPAATLRFTLRTANSWVAGFCMEKAAHHGASSTGENLSTGGILSVNLQKTGSAAASASRAYICAHYDCCLELKDSGAHVWS